MQQAQDENENFDPVRMLRIEHAEELLKDLTMGIERRHRKLPEIKEALKRHTDDMSYLILAHIRIIQDASIYFNGPDEATASKARNQIRGLMNWLTAVDTTPENTIVALAALAAITEEHVALTRTHTHILFGPAAQTIVYMAMEITAENFDAPLVYGNTWTQIISQLTPLILVTSALTFMAETMRINLTQHFAFDEWQLCGPPAPQYWFTIPGLDERGFAQFQIFRPSLNPVIDEYANHPPPPVRPQIWPRFPQCNTLLRVFNHRSEIFQSIRIFTRLTPARLHFVPGTMVTMEPMFTPQLVQRYILTLTLIDTVGS